MKKPIAFDPSTHVVGLDREIKATRLPEQPDPPIPFAGVTFGVAAMSENSPHGGEMHPDGDEVLYLISGHIKVVFLDDPVDTIDVRPGGGLVVPRGMWHRVDIIEPSEIAYLTPGPNNEFRPVEAS